MRKKTDDQVCEQAEMERNGCMRTDNEWLDKMARQMEEIRGLPEAAGGRGMKVSVTCENCGTVYVRTMERVDDYTLRGVCEGEYTLYCPKCSEPTYGPITVDMVAEMLYESRCSFDENYSGGKYPDGDEAREADLAEARAVIRLLEFVQDEELHTGGTGTTWNDGEYWRNKVVELAKGE